ncbi:MAG: hypothetical protein A2Y12_11160 [Planctomycetes bacterium GWF2_42_9]|nr:MAG: hypothetical protein A2Y12_11160 [Planctomycetes bacterium GWF2_42_9]HAL45263.1 hypothetical protein [Phycisphaerales bacterium]
MVDDSLIKPVVNQNAFSIKSARDKDLNDKKKRQNNNGEQQMAEEAITEEVNDSEIEEEKKFGDKNSIDFCA